MRDDPVASMFADLDNKEMHGIGCGRGDLSANSNQHSANRIGAYGSGSTHSSSEPTNWGLMGMIFCSSWIGFAAQSWKVFAGFFVAVVVAVVIGDYCCKSESREKFERITLLLIGGLSAIGVCYLNYYAWGMQGLIVSIIGMISIAILVWFCKTKFAKALGNLIIRIITVTFYTTGIGLALYGAYFFIVQ